MYDFKFGDIVENTKELDGTSLSGRSRIVFVERRGVMIRFITREGAFVDYTDMYSGLKKIGSILKVNLSIINNSIEK